MHKMVSFKEIKTNTKYLHLYKGEYDVDGLSLPYEIVSRKDADTMFGGMSLGHGVDAVCIVPFPVRHQHVLLGIPRRAH